MTAIVSKKRQIPISSGVKKTANVRDSRVVDSPNENEMGETAENATTLDYNITKMSISDRDNKSGDWKKDTDSKWYTEVQKNDERNTNLSTESMTEWKCKNLYSISARNYELLNDWNPGRTAVLANALLGDGSNDDEEKSVLMKFREYLANYQESHGVPRTEYTFPALIKVMGQATGRSLLALLYVVLNITPIAQILLHILRFILDKTISIQNTNDFRQMLVKYAILGLQLLCIYVCLVFIFGCIVMPIVYMAIGIIVKITLYD